MTKNELRALEKIFSHEIDQALNHHNLPFQSKAKVYETLEADGMIKYVTVTVGSGWSAVNVSGWQLTLLGHVTYCLTCSDCEDV
jgi:hypothetical protein